LECFIVVAEELHFGRAARRLGIAQPGLTRAVQTLERRLGMQLVGRDSRSVTLTEAGRSMLDAGRDVVAQHRSLMAQAEALRRSASLSLAIAADSAFAGLLLASAVREYRTLHPGSTARLDWLAHGASAAEALAAGAHIALTAGEAPRATTRAQTLLSTERMLVVSNSHRLARREPVERATLAGERLLTPRRAAAGWLPEWWPALPGVLPAASVEDQARGQAGDFDTFDEGLELAAAGLGALVAPALARARHPRHDLSWVVIADLPPVEVNLTWRADRETQAVKSFIAVCARVARLHVHDGGNGTARSRDSWRARPAIAALAG
jgi:DNA-binding transcriptional LysR family regulator